MAKGIQTSGSFTTLVSPQTGVDPTFPAGFNKSRLGLTKTFTYGPISDSRGILCNGALNATPPFATASGHFLVADNTFPGVVELIVGDYRLVPIFDYVIGVDTVHTAINIAAAISKLPGFSASALASVVTVRSVHQADDIDFRAIHHSTVLSFTSFTGSGFLTQGVPFAGPPIEGA